MSGRTVTNLEEFFLRSRERGSRGVPRSQFEVEGVRPPIRAEHPFVTSIFGQRQQQPEIRPVDMNRPVATVLAFAPQTPAARQRAIAAIGGIAAVALVAVGVTSGLPHVPGSGHGQQALVRKGGPHLPPLDAAPAARGAASGVIAQQAADHVHGAAGGLNGTGVRGSFSVFVGAGESSPTGGTASSGRSPSGGSSVAPTLPSAPNPVATVSNPVTQLSSDVGTAVSTTVQQINAAVPTATPITGVVNNVGTTVSGLSGMLAAPNA
jgi:hypothetical protein